MFKLPGSLGNVCNIARIKIKLVLVVHIYKSVFHNNDLSKQTKPIVIKCLFFFFKTTYIHVYEYSCVEPEFTVYKYC